MRIRTSCGPNAITPTSWAGSHPTTRSRRARGAWGQPYADLWALERIRAPEAWDITRGEGVVVAVVDSGLDYLHPDVAENVWVHPGEDLNGNGRLDPEDQNGVDDDGNGFVDDLIGFDFANSIDADQDGRFDGPTDVSDADPFDDRGHGTHVAGTIAAVADNGIGIAGVAPEARLMSIKGFGASGSAPDSTLWRGVVYAIENGADVVNNSWSCSPFCPENPLADEVIALAAEAGVVIVTSAGNRESDVIHNSPENGAGVITVASSGENDDLSRTFTNFGWLIDVTAPGGGPPNVPGVQVPRRNMLSLRSSAIDDADPFIVANDYYRWAGTSMAAPHVAGVVALLRSVRPELDVRGIRRILRQSAVDLGAAGHDREFGAGRLDAFAALTHPPLPDIELSIDAPAQRAVFRGTPSSVEVRGRIKGRDVARYELSVGAGNVPSEWIPLVAEVGAPEIDGGRIGAWPLDGLDEGTYVLRLQAESTQGDLYSEYALVSLERPAPRPVSSAGQDALAADLHGDFVVWQSLRDPEDPEARSTALNVFVTRLSSGAERAVAAGPNRQHSPTISRRTVAWLEVDAETGASRVRGCVLQKRRTACTPFDTPSSDGVTVPPASAAGRVFWVDAVDGRLDLRGCSPNPASGTCVEFDLGLPPANRGFPRSDGETLTWVEAGPVLTHGFCRIQPDTGRCDGQTPAQAIRAVSRPAASGNLLAWVGLDFGGRNPLTLCAYDAATGECPEIVVDRFVTDPVPRLFGDRLVWEKSVGDQASDVFFCEYDRVLERCPIQRLTAELSGQTGADVHRNRVAWSDARDGGTRIYGRTLPTLSSPVDRIVTEGRRLTVPIFGRAGSTQTMTLDGTLPGGEAIDSIGMRLRSTQRGHGGAFGLLSWRPDASQVGEHVVTIAGTTADGLVSRSTFRIEVVPRRPPEPRFSWLLEWLRNLLRAHWPQR